MNDSGIAIAHNRRWLRSSDNVGNGLLQRVMLDSDGHGTSRLMLFLR